ncbi:transposable element Tcb2 transposase [Trichonephila clavipes]|nr:transposable element Tcb2 transposase [Trichonephila clavipes]
MSRSNSASQAEFSKMGPSTEVYPLAGASSIEEYIDGLRTVAVLQRNRGKTVCLRFKPRADYNKSLESCWSVRREPNSSRISASHWSVTKCDLQDLETFFGDWKCKRPGQGRRRATTPNEDRYLVLMARRHRNMNATLLQQHLRSVTGTRVSTQTVRNWLHGVGLYAY